MRFLDANIFVYAYYKAKKPLSQKEQAMKEQAQNIIRSVSEGKEEITTTVVQLSEVVNILKHGMPKDSLTRVILGLFMLDNVKIVDVTRDGYFAAVELSEDYSFDPNDALALDVMRQNGIAEVYSFDDHFSKIEGIKRLPVV
ncbi:MAG: type II toxin-antitoxin system VapC family toxin [Candidatus Bathyarchaeota archaeon]|nr:type II toxin-antitoxin system VapC family toxin [Candidatus Bathyarchaeota archaeon]